MTHRSQSRLVRRVEDDLRDLTMVLSARRLVDPVGGLLGGEYGYGAHYTSETFTLRPYYWGDCTCDREAAEAAWIEAHPHTPECFQSQLRLDGFIDYGDPGDVDMPWRTREDLNDAVVARTAARMGLDTTVWSLCTCGRTQAYDAWWHATPHAETCGVDKPNFVHHPSGTTVSWYKYLGRGMEVELGDLAWDAVRADILHHALTTRMPEGRMGDTTPTHEEDPMDVYDQHQAITEIVAAYQAQRTTADAAIDAITEVLDSNDTDQESQ